MNEFIHVILHLIGLTLIYGFYLEFEWGRRGSTKIYSGLDMDLDPCKVEKGKVKNIRYKVARLEGQSVEPQLSHQGLSEQNISALRNTRVNE